MKGLRVTEDLTKSTCNGYKFMAVITTLLFVGCTILLFTKGVLIMPSTFKLLFITSIVVESLIAFLCICEVIMMHCGSVYYLRIDAVEDKEDLPDNVMIVGRWENGDQYARVCCAGDDDAGSWM